MITTILAIKNYYPPTFVFFSFYLGQIGIFYKTNDQKHKYFKESLYNPQFKHN